MTLYTVDDAGNVQATESSFKVDHTLKTKTEQKQDRKNNKKKTNSDGGRFGGC